MVFFDLEFYFATEIHLFVRSFYSTNIEHVVYQAAYKVLRVQWKMITDVDPVLRHWQLFSSYEEASGILGAKRAASWENRV